MYFYFIFAFAMYLLIFYVTSSFIFGLVLLSGLAYLNASCSIVQGSLSESVNLNHVTVYWTNLLV